MNLVPNRNHKTSYGSHGLPTSTSTPNDAIDQHTERYTKLISCLQVLRVQLILVRFDLRKSENKTDCNQIKEGKYVERLDPEGRYTDCRKEEAGSAAVTPICVHGADGNLLAATPPYLICFYKL